MLGYSIKNSAPTGIRNAIFLFLLECSLTFKGAIRNVVDQNIPNISSLGYVCRMYVLHSKS